MRAAGAAVRAEELQPAGVPVLASDIPTHREVGETAAAYFSTFDADDLADKCDQLMGDELTAKGFQDMRFWTTRHDVPVLAQIPLLNLFFDRQKGFAVKRPFLRLINALRPPEARGTFFVMEAVKP